jgi:hypothetical protein
MPLIDAYTIPPTLYVVFLTPETWSAMYLGCIFYLCCLGCITYSIIGALCGVVFVSRLKVTLQKYGRVTHTTIVEHHTHTHTHHGRKIQFSRGVRGIEIGIEVLYITKRSIKLYIALVMRKLFVCYIFFFF